MAKRAKRRRQFGASEYGSRRSPALPTAALPGSPAKIEVMAARAENGRHIHHPADARWEANDRWQWEVWRDRAGNVIHGTISERGQTDDEIAEIEERDNARLERMQRGKLAKILIAYMRGRYGKLAQKAVRRK